MLYLMYKVIQIFTSLQNPNRSAISVVQITSDEVINYIVTTLSISNQLQLLLSEKDVIFIITGTAEQNVIDYN